MGERLEKLTGGQLRIETMFAGQVVPAFEILDAASKRIIDGGHSISYYWVGKNKATDRKSTRLNSSHMSESRMPSSA